MTSKKRSSEFRRKVKKRLTKVIGLAQIHCGHQGPMEEAWEVEEKFVDWLVSEMEAVWPA